MFKKCLGAVRITLVILITVVISGCAVKTQEVPGTDISGAFFTKDIGCTIYFIWGKKYGGEGVKKYVHELDDLYCIRKDGGLQRLYESQKGKEPMNFLLSNYQYPLLIEEWMDSIQILGADHVKREVIKFDSEENNLSYFFRFYDDGKKALLRLTRRVDRDYKRTLAVLDCESGQILWEIDDPWPKEHWIFRGTDENLDYGLVFVEKKEGSYSKEMRTWWVPFIVHFPGNGTVDYKPLELPDGVPKGVDEVIMLRDGRLIGLTHDGSTARFYQSYAPYSEYELIYEGAMPVPEILSSSRDGTRMVLSWYSEDNLFHWSIFEPETGRFQEFYVQNDTEHCWQSMLSPDGDRIVWVSKDASVDYTEAKESISVYDAEEGELIEKMIWEYGGFIKRIKVGY